MKKQVIVKMIELGLNPNVKGFEYLLFEYIGKFGKEYKFLKFAQVEAARKRKTNILAIDKSIRYCISKSNVSFFKNRELIEHLEKIL